MILEQIANKFAIGASIISGNKVNSAKLEFGKIDHRRFPVILKREMQPCHRTVFFPQRQINQSKNGS